MIMNKIHYWKVNIMNFLMFVTLSCKFKYFILLNYTY